MSERFFLAQISDTHVRTDDGGAAASNLRRALAAAAAYRCDAIMLTGDLANDERAEEYAILAEAITGASAPLFLMPGNHDERGHLRRTFPNHTYLPRNGPLSYVIDDFPIRLIAIDDIVPGETNGLFTEDQAIWLETMLAADVKKPTIVALHHPPFLTHDLLFDRIGLMEPDLFASVIARHPQVARIICGHHHRVAVGQVAHAPVVVAPSTSWIYGLAMHEGQQIAPKTAEQPGWMLHAYAEGSGFASHFMGL